MIMGDIRVLDCTLRDGGYVNKWNWGKETITETVSLLKESNVEIVEVGFIRDVQYDENASVFSSMEQVKKVIGKKKENQQYAVMAEISNPIPLSMVEAADVDGPDIVRVICWKSRRNDKGEVVDCLHDSFEYCKGFVEKGYKLCVQPNRVDQYSDEEFLEMLKLFAPLNPMAIYVVDSWGTLYSDKVLHYMHLADDYLPKNIAIGYHGHNNMMQAFANAEAVIKENFDREIIIDASVYGIGRGAGNLNLELIAKYMNEKCGKKYNTTEMYTVYDRFVQSEYGQKKWGYSLPFLLTAKHNTNPNYAEYYSENAYGTTDQEDMYDEMSESGRVIYSAKYADSVAKQLKKKSI